ncbi:SDR family oxidoreductase [Kibdelosporangium philippinense]|uniref:SDR family oxidoreductase n=1 Tax=Kibdelosporangium philippinense TaxID=211113 RepID=A0ABS8Z717_9PSEU|nr:SDR family oxidoreductase [Kibdelosporangium philippinense]MCE7003675.1 SDR family oxidoreductase [Kibdelosporangium philippinense]
MKVAVVTGAASGIGRAVAHRLSNDGYHVIAADLTAGSAGASLRPYLLDVTDAEAVDRLASSLSDCRVLVNNAAIWRFERLMDATDEVMATNLYGPLRLMRKLVPLMRDGGAVVNITLVVTTFPPRGLGLYPPSKAALETVTRMAAVEFGPLGVRCNAVAPGLIPTEGTMDFYGSPQDIAAKGSLLPLGTPDEVAAAVSFLASDDSRYVTGQVLAVDGGYLAAGAGFFAAAASGRPMVRP